MAIRIPGHTLINHTRQPISDKPTNRFYVSGHTYIYTDGRLFLVADLYSAKVVTRVVQVLEERGQEVTVKFNWENV